MNRLITATLLGAFVLSAPCLAQQETEEAAPGGDPIVKMHQEVAAAYRTYNAKVAAAKKVYDQKKAVAAKERDAELAAARGGVSQ